MGVWQFCELDTCDQRTDVGAHHDDDDPDDDGHLPLHLSDRNYRQFVTGGLEEVVFRAFREVVNNCRTRSIETNWVSLFFQDNQPADTAVLPN